jgi:hypothetical protein
LNLFEALISFFDRIKVFENQLFVYSIFILNIVGIVETLTSQIECLEFPSSKPKKKLVQCRVKLAVLINLNDCCEVAL